MSAPLRIPLLVAGALASIAVVASMLYLSAGRWAGPMWWAYLAVLAILTLTAVPLMDPGLIRERIRPGPGGRDMIVIPVGKLLIITHLLMAGGDVGRFHRSDDVPPAVQIGALALFGAAFGLAVWAMIVNRFFSPLIRLQAERDHCVISSGPYRIVRHPGYTAFCVGMLASGVALGSWLSMLPMALMVVIIIRRTVLEDQFLLAELEGYDAYARRIRYRLFPGVW